MINSLHFLSCFAIWYMMLSMFWICFQWNFFGVKCSKGIGIFFLFAIHNAITFRFTWKWIEIQHQQAHTHSLKFVAMTCVCVCMTTLEPNSSTRWDVLSFLLYVHTQPESVRLNKNLSIVVLSVTSARTRSHSPIEIHKSWHHCQLIWWNMSASLKLLIYPSKNHTDTFNTTDSYYENFSIVISKRNDTINFDGRGGGGGEGRGKERKKNVFDKYSTSDSNEKRNVRMNFICS